MSVKENLIKAKALIDTPEKWGRGEYVKNECFCAIGALAEALGVNPVSSGLTMSKEYEALLGAVPDTFYGVWRYNDAEDTTHSDIMALYDRAIAAAE